jgi:sec-independent protein translocase protein TatB
MFDIGWSEMAVIAMIALIVIGPKDLPNTMKTIAHWMRKARSLTREFQSGIDEMVREAELEDAKKALEATRSGNFERTISNAIDPDDEVGGEVRDIEREARREDSASGGDGKAGAGAGNSEAEQGSSRVASANVAPAHSLTPPESGEPAGEDAGGGSSSADGAAAAAGREGSKRSA